MPRYTERTDAIRKVLLEQQARESEEAKRAALRKRVDALGPAGQKKAPKRSITNG